MQMNISASGCANRKMCNVRPDPRPPLTLVGVTVECHYDSRVLGGPNVPPLLHCLSSSLSFTLKTSFSPHCSCPVPPLHPLMPPVEPSPRSLCLHTNCFFSSCILEVTMHSDKSLGPDGWPVVVIWTRSSLFWFFTLHPIYWFYPSWTHWAVKCLRLEFPAHRPWPFQVR